MQRRYRLKKSAEFQRVRALKRSWAHPLMVLYVAPNDLEIVRVGISTSKRIGKAVARNRAKRLIREAVRLLLPRVTPGHDLVFVARPAIAEADFEQVGRAVEILLRRARILSLPSRAPGERGLGRRDELGKADTQVDRPLLD